MNASNTSLKLENGFLIPDWPASPHVKALFSTREGGVSAAPFDSLNLGDHVGDNPADVALNRQLLQTNMAARPVFLQQVHGTAVVDLTPQTPDGSVADACMTAHTGVACTIMVADCLPVLFTDVDGSFVAAAHAGWRGLAQGVLKNTLDAVNMQFKGHFMPLAGVNVGYNATKIIAWLGPCIGPTAFEVGDEVRAAFVAQSADTALTASQFQAHGAGKWLANLSGLARLQLQSLGVTNIYGNDGSLPWCTATQSSRFFSHRRDAAVLGGSGRMAACVWRV